jgi:hypothetical protein
LHQAGRLSLSICGLLLLLLLSAATSVAAADVIPPRLYLPLVGREFGPAWQWQAPITPTLAPAPNHLALALDNAGQPHILWDTTAYGEPRFIYHTTTAGAMPGLWNKPAPVAASLGESTLLDAPVPGPDGALHLLWHNLAEPNRQQQLLYAALRNGAWSAPEVTYQAGGSINGMVRAGSAGQLRL